MASEPKGLLDLLDTLVATGDQLINGESAPPVSELHTWQTETGAILGSVSDPELRGHVVDAVPNAGKTSSGSEAEQLHYSREVLRGLLRLRQSIIDNPQLSGTQDRAIDPDRRPPVDPMERPSNDPTPPLTHEFLRKHGPPPPERKVGDRPPAPRTRPPTVLRKKPKRRRGMFSTELKSRRKSAPVSPEATPPTVENRPAGERTDMPESATPNSLVGHLDRLLAEGSPLRRGREADAGGHRLFYAHVGHFKKRITDRMLREELNALVPWNGPPGWGSGYGPQPYSWRTSQCVEGLGRFRPILVEFEVRKPASAGAAPVGNLGELPINLGAAPKPQPVSPPPSPKNRQDLAANATALSDPPPFETPPWRPIKSLGKGGTGKVYHVVSEKVFNRQAVIDTLGKDLRQATATAGSPANEQRLLLERLLTNIQAAAFPPAAASGALKIPHDYDKPEAQERLKREIAVMRSCMHPSAVSIIDADPQNRWFVMELLPGGTLHDKRSDYTGQPLKALQAIRGVVEAAAGLHTKGLVHRDIKPRNIFLSATGSLLLGDFGIAIHQDEEDTRLTNADETMGSRSWLPLWVFHRKTPDYTPRADVYMLGKVIYAMVSRERNVQAPYLEDEPFDLRRQFPQSAEMLMLHELLKRIIVVKESECLPDGGAVLGEVDRLIRSLSPVSRLEVATRQMRYEFEATVSARFTVDYVLRQAYAQLRQESMGQPFPSSLSEAVKEAARCFPPPGQVPEGSMEEVILNWLPLVERAKPLWTLVSRVYPSSPGSPPRNTILGDIVRLNVFHDALLSTADFWNRWASRAFHESLPPLDLILRDYTSSTEELVEVAFLILALARSNWDSQVSRVPLLRLVQTWPQA